MILSRSIFEFKRKYLLFLNLNGFRKRFENRPSARLILNKDLGLVPLAFVLALKKTNEEPEAELEDTTLCSSLTKFLSGEKPSGITEWPLSSEGLQLKPIEPVSDLIEIDRVAFASIMAATHPRKAL